MLCCVAIYTDLAIDVERQMLYYADDATNDGKVGELSTDGTAHRVLIRNIYSSPRSVVIDVDNRLQHPPSQTVHTPVLFMESGTFY